MNFQPPRRIDRGFNFNKYVCCIPCTFCVHQQIHFHWIKTNGLIWVYSKFKCTSSYLPGEERLLEPVGDLSIDLRSGEVIPDLRSGEVIPDLCSGEVIPELCSGEDIPDRSSGFSDLLTGDVTVLPLVGDTALLIEDTDGLLSVLIDPGCSSLVWSLVCFDGDEVWHNSSTCSVAYPAEGLTCCLEEWMSKVFKGPWLEDKLFAVFSGDVVLLDLDVYWEAEETCWLDLRAPTWSNGETFLLDIGVYCWGHCRLLLLLPSKTDNLDNGDDRLLDDDPVGDAFRLDLGVYLAGEECLLDL